MLLSNHKYILITQSLHVTDCYLEAKIPSLSLFTLLCNVSVLTTALLSNDIIK